MISIWQVVGEEKELITSDEEEQSFKAEQVMVLMKYYNIY